MMMMMMKCHMFGYDTIRYDSGYLTCSKKLTGSQLSLPHGINRKLKCETKNKMMSVISVIIFVPFPLVIIDYLGGYRRAIYISRKLSSS